MGAAVATQMAVEQAPARLFLECPFTSIAEMGRLLWSRSSNPEELMLKL